MEILLIAAGIAAVIVLWIISVQRNLVHLSEACENAISSIGVQLSSRWDALTSLAQLMEKYAEHESGIMNNVMEQRKAITRSSSVDEVDSQEPAFSKTFHNIMALAEAYPDLKANTVYMNTMDGIKEYENKVRMSRMVYNDTVTKLNRKVKMFPNNIAASLLGYHPWAYLETEQLKTEMPTF